jgi:endonuclease III
MQSPQNQKSVQQIFTKWYSNFSQGENTMQSQQYANLFAPALASQSQDEGASTVSDDLMRRAVKAWSIPTAAYPLLRRAADRLLADGRQIVLDGSNWSYA